MEVAKRNIHILYHRRIRPLLRSMSFTSAAATAVFPEEDLALSKGSLILVTGATGYVASHIINEALLLGYRVRGTVRSEEKGARIRGTFDDDGFETVVVGDLTDAEAFDAACQGCDGVIHPASVVSFSANPNEVIPATVAGAVNVLRSAVKAGTVKRFVYTSSSVATTLPVLDKEFAITKETWNDASVDKVRALKEPFDRPEDGYDVYGASKTEAERAVWKFVEEEKPPFVVNCVLPNANMGKIITNPGPTGGFAISILKGEFQPWVPPQWFVDTADDAKIHIAALIDKRVANDRIFAFAEPFDWNDVIDAVHKARPDATTIIEKLPPHGKDLSQVDNAQGAELLRKWFGQDGWKSLEESVKENLEGL